MYFLSFQLTMFNNSNRSCYTKFAVLTAVLFQSPPSHQECDAGQAVRPPLHTSHPTGLESSRPSSSTSKMRINTSARIELSAGKCDVVQLPFLRPLCKAISGFPVFILHCRVKETQFLSQVDIRVLSPNTITDTQSLSL